MDNPGELYFEFGSRLNLAKVFEANNILADLASSKKQIGFDIFFSTCSALNRILKEIKFDRVLESTAGKGFKDASEALFGINNRLFDGEISFEDAEKDAVAYRKIIRLLAREMQNIFLDELRTFPAIFPSFKDELSKWVHVKKQFAPDIYPFLPPMVQKDLQESANCLILDQYNASSIMALRAVEAMLKETYERLSGEEADNEDNWGKLHRKLRRCHPEFLHNKSLGQKLEELGEKRNSFAHPTAKTLQTSLVEANTSFIYSVDSLTELVELLKRENQLLSIALPNYFSIDIFFAAYLLHHYQNGVGRITFIAEKDTIYENHFNYLIGVKGFKNNPGDSYADRMADQLRYQGIFQNDPYVETILSCSRELAQSDEQSDQLFPNLLRVLLNVIKPEMAKYKFYRFGFELLDDLRINNLNPFDPNLRSEILKNWPGKYKIGRDGRLCRARFDAQTGENRVPVSFLGLKGIIAVMEREFIPEGIKELRKQGYEFVSLTDEKRYFEINGPKNKPWERLIEQLKKRMAGLDIVRSDTDLKFNDRIEIHFKKNEWFPLTVNDIIQCFLLASN